MTRVRGDWIDRAETRAVMRMLGEAGHRALFVGGCVRNALLGQPVTDIDIATDALPDRVMALATGAGLHPVPTGIDHGTVTVVSGGLPHEVTTFRRDVATDGRRAVVAFSDDVAQDAMRRDFTMNALYAEADGTLVDPLGGLADLNARRLRFVGAAEDRIREDTLRILRFFRFHAFYADADRGFDPGDLAAIGANLAGLETLSRERVGAEMLKLLAAPDPAPSIAVMAQTGVLAQALPGAVPDFLAPLVHLEEGVEPDPIRRLAALGGEDAADRLRLSKAQARQLDLLRSAVAEGAGPGELAYRHGAQTARDVMLLRSAMAGQPLPDGLEREIATGAAAAFPVSAADLRPGLEGPALGARLRELEDRWIASGFALTRDDLLS